MWAPKPRQNTKPWRVRAQSNAFKIQAVYSHTRQCLEAIFYESQSSPMLLKHRNKGFQHVLTGGNPDKETQLFKQCFLEGLLWPLKGGSQAAVLSC